MSTDKPIGSGLGILCLPEFLSNDFNTMDVHVFPLVCTGIVIILHDILYKDINIPHINLHMAVDPSAR